MTEQAASLDDWKRDVAEALADPDHFAFLAAVPGLLVIGGRHSDKGYCWCQPRRRVHGNHSHYEHKRTQD